MKNILKTSFVALLVAGTVSAQSLVNESETVEIVTIDNTPGKMITIKTVNHEAQAVIFDKDDRNKVNQSTEHTPVRVRKTIYIDNDNDAAFDKEVQLSYTKNGNHELEYVATSEGVFISTSKNTTRLVSEDGAHRMDAENVDNISIIIKTIADRRK